MTSDTEMKEGFTRVGLVYDQTKGYATNIHCLNCSECDTIYIPYGETIKNYLDNKECPHCKCKGVLY